MKWLKRILGVRELETRLDGIEEVLKQILIEIRNSGKETDQKLLFLGNKLIGIEIELKKKNGS